MVTLLSKDSDLWNSPVTFPLRDKDYSCLPLRSLKGRADVHSGFTKGPFYRWENEAVNSQRPGGLEESVTPPCLLQAYSASLASVFSCLKWS